MRYCSLLLFLFLAACVKQPKNSITSFSDGFENYNTVDEVVSDADEAWTYFNLNEINVSTEPFRLDTTIVHSGSKSLRFHCKQIDAEYKEVCKCNLNKNNLFFKIGDVVYFSAWYYVERSDNNYGTFFILDLEEIVNGSTGVRIMAWEENLEFERGKIGLSNIFQESNVSLIPVNQWTHVEMKLRLSQDRNGWVRMWLDGKEIINCHNIITLPKDHINLAWGTKGYYERAQVGITAKGGTEELIIYVDDVELRIE